MPSPLRYGSIAGVGLAARSVALAALWRHATGEGQDISIDVGKALRRFCNKRFEIPTLIPAALCIYLPKFFPHHSERSLEPAQRQLQCAPSYAVFTILVLAVAVSSNLFSILGVQPTMGREFSTSEQIYQPCPVGCRPQYSLRSIVVALLDMSGISLSKQFKALLAFLRCFLR